MSLVPWVPEEGGYYRRLEDLMSTNRKQKKFVGHRGFSFLSKLLHD